MSASYETRLMRVFDFIYANPGADLSLDALADVAAMSRFHWHRVFRAMTGETVAEAVRRVRMYRAAAWLVAEDWPVPKIADRVGYANPRSFARSFAAIFGMTPAAFRKRGVPIGLPGLPKKGGKEMKDVTIQVAPARRLAAMPHRGAYVEIGRAFEKLSAVIGARNLWGKTREMIGVYYDDPSQTPVDKLRSHAAVVLEKGVAVPDGLEEITLPAGPVGVLRFRGPYSGLFKAYDHLYCDWLPESGRDLRDAPAFEVYQNTPADTAPEDLLTDVCLPVK
ncbi:MAG: AraC family transcriptional regulator [Paracoccaceae bacterium]